MSHKMKKLIFNVSSPNTYYPMKLLRHYLLLLLILSISIPFTYAQDHSCGFDQLQEQALKKMGISLEEFADNYQTLIQKYRHRLASSEGRALDSKIYKVPIVFHIFHSQGNTPGRGDNLSKSIVEAAVRQLNDMFNPIKRNVRRSVPSIYRDVDAGDVGVEFFLAQRDPEGFPTNGIQRIEIPPGSNFSSHLGRQNFYKFSKEWDRLRYLNIWVAPIRYGEFDDDGSYIAGFAHLPAIDFQNLSLGFLNPKSFQFVGARYDDDVFSTMGTPTDETYSGPFVVTENLRQFGNITLGHELGHFFSLLHPFQGGCQATRGDYCSDTPPMLGPTPNRCAGNTSCGSRDMAENYMSYSPDRCYALFTKCQRERIRAALEYSGSGASTFAPDSVITPIKTRPNDLGILRFSNLQVNRNTGAVSGSIQVGNYGQNAITSFEIDIFIDDTKHSTSIQYPSSSSVSFAPFDGTRNNEGERTTGLIELSLPNNLFASEGVHEFSVRIASVNSMPNDSYAPNDELTTQVLRPMSTSDLSGEDFDSGLPSNFFFSGPEKVYDVVDQVDGNGKMAMIDLMNSPASTGLRVFQLYSPKYTFPATGNSDEYLELTFRYSFQGPPDTSINSLDVETYFTHPTDERKDEFSEYYTNIGIDMYTAAHSARLRPGQRPRYADDWRTLHIPLHLNRKKPSGEGICISILNGRNGRLYIDDLKIQKKTKHSIDLRGSVIAPSIVCVTSVRNVTNGAPASSLTWNIHNLGTTAVSQRNYSVYTSLLPSASQRTVSIVRPARNIFPALDPNGLNHYYGGAYVQIGRRDALYAIATDVRHQSSRITDEDPSNNRDTSYVYSISRVPAFPVSVETFESSVSNASKWYPATSLDRDWERTTNYAKASFYNSSHIGKAYKLISPIYLGGRLTDVTELSLSFRVSYAHRSDATKSDRLQLVAFTECVPTPAAILYEKAGADLSVQASDSEWTPQSNSDWRTETIDLKQFIDDKDLVLMFVATNEGGNHLYIDDIALTTSLPEDSTPPVAEGTEFKLYPNPVAQEVPFNVEFYSSQIQGINISILDVSGKKILDRMYHVRTGNQRIQISFPPAESTYFKSHVYVFHLKGETLEHYTRFVRK